MYQPDSNGDAGSKAPAGAVGRPTLMKRMSRPILALGGLVVLLSAFLAGTAPAPVSSADAAAVATAGLEPTERQRRVSKLVSNVMERSHYRQSPVNDPVSSLVLDRYLESLDGSRSYFLASDVAEFERFRFQLDDALLAGNIEPAFAIFNRFQTRNRERMEYALALLDTEPDFTVEETFEFDRTKAPWAKTNGELDEVWRKRIKNDAVSLLLTDKTWTESRELLKTRYERVLKRTDQVTTDDAFEVFMNAFVHVFDPHSSYFSPRNSEEYKIQMSLSYEGIGASLQLVEDYVTVLNVLPGGPAAISGQLTANDRILSVGEGRDGKLVDVIGWRLDDVVQIIRGKINTTVRLQVLPAGAAPGSETRIIEFTRNKVLLENAAAKKSTQKIKRGDSELTIGVISIPSFYQDFDARSAGEKDYKSTTRDTRKLIDELKAEGMDGLVIDLRGNGGGHLTEATALSGLFIPAGPVVQLRETGGRIEVLDDPEPTVAWDGPLAVLVDRFSASASEIFAAAVQDYGRGVVVGQQTYGKGTVQNLYPLDRYALGSDPGFGQLTVTIGKFYRVTGESTQHRGVQPDIELPSAISPDDVGESTRESALPWDRIRPAAFGKDANFNQAFAPLVAEHQRRTATDPDFQFLVNEIGAYERERAEKAVSLNLKTRLDDRERLQAERLTRENARREALGLPAVDSLDAATTEEARDALLIETAQIVGDLQGMGGRFVSKVAAPAR